MRLYITKKNVLYLAFYLFFFNIAYLTSCEKKPKSVDCQGIDCDQDTELNPGTEIISEQEGIDHALGIEGGSPSSDNITGTNPINGPYSPSNNGSRGGIGTEGNGNGANTGGGIGTEGNNNPRNGGGRTQNPPPTNDNNNNGNPNTGGGGTTPGNPTDRGGGLGDEGNNNPRNGGGTQNTPPANNDNNNPNIGQERTTPRNPQDGGSIYRDEQGRTVPNIIGETDERGRSRSGGGTYTPWIDNSGLVPEAGPGDSSRSAGGSYTSNYNYPPIIIPEGGGNNDLPYSDGQGTYIPMTDQGRTGNGSYLPVGSNPTIPQTYYPSTSTGGGVYNRDPKSDVTDESQPPFTIGDRYLPPTNPDDGSTPPNNCPSITCLPPTTIVTTPPTNTPPSCTKPSCDSTTLTTDQSIPSTEKPETNQISTFRNTKASTNENTSLQADSKSDIGPLNFGNELDFADNNIDSACRKDINKKLKYEFVNNLNKVILISSQQADGTFKETFYNMNNFAVNAYAYIKKDNTLANEFSFFINDRLYTTYVQRFIHNGIYNAVNLKKIYLEKIKGIVKVEGEYFDQNENQRKNIDIPIAMAYNGSFTIFSKDAISRNLLRFNFHHKRLKLDFSKFGSCLAKYTRHDTGDELRFPLVIGY